MPNVKDYSDLLGWVRNDKEVDKVLETLKYPLFLAACSAIKESGEGKTVLLYKFVEKLIGKFNTRVQGTGDCVSFGTATAIDCVKAAEIISGQREEWIAETSTEDIYGGSRVLIGGNRLNGQQGSFGAWSARYVSEYGTLVRQKYDGVDLTKYDVNRAIKWGDNGVPKALLNDVSKHRIRTISLVKTYAEVRDAIANGYGVYVCSSTGMSNKRDKYGFSVPSGKWGHCMAVTAVDDVGVGMPNRCSSVLVQNSWPVNWISGPTRLDQPPGSFWITADILESEFLAQGDSFVLSDYQGYPAKKLNLRII